VDRLSRIDIHLDAIDHNLAVVRRALARESQGRHVGVCAVLKADGYGAGAAPLARRLEHAGIEMVAVYSPAEAANLAEAGVTTPILVLAPVDHVGFDGALFHAARAGRVHLTVHSPEQLQAIIACAELLGSGGRRLPVHVEVDTGMSRGGSPPDVAAALVRRIVNCERLALAGVFSHLASADRDAAASCEQDRAFARWCDSVRSLLPETCATHFSNTYGVFRSPTLHRDMVRVGLALLGYGEEEFAPNQVFALREDAAALRPAVRWVTRVAHVSRIPAGARVGYGGLWQARRPTTLALAPVGYADGYPLGLARRTDGEGGVVGIGVQDATAFVPVVGAVSMDQITIDATDLAHKLAIGSEVEVIGLDKRAPTHLPTVAKAAGTISHELLCRLSPRVPRKYLSPVPGTPTTEPHASARTGMTEPRQNP